MRIISLFFVFLFAGFSLNAQSRTGPVSLEQAIAGAVAAVEAKFQRDTVITVEKIEAPSTDTANSITRTLIKSFIDSGKLAVVARGADLNPVDREIGKNLSGDIGDEYYIGPGHFRSAEVVITGIFSRYENSGELWIRATEVGSSVILVEYSKPVQTGPAQSSPAAAAVLNMAFGLGSFIIQKDTKGGAITAALEGIGVAAVVVSRFLVTNKEETDPWTGLWYTRRDTSLSTPVLFAGLAAYAGGAIFGAVRAFNFQKPGNSVGKAGSIPFNISLVSGSQGNVAMQFNYSMYF